MSNPRESAARPGWLLDEVAGAGRENLDPGHVTRYDTKMDAGAGAEVRVLTDLGLSGESVVIDWARARGSSASRSHRCAPG